jgi:proline iminopeptidase
VTRPESRRGSTDTANTPRMVQCSGAELAVRDSGGEGTPVVFLSGGPGMPDYLQDIAERLNGRRTVSYDQRGTGRSVVSDGDYSTEAHVADLERLRTSLGAHQLHLFGHSWGGMLAQLYATTHSERVASLYLVSPTTGVGSDWVAMERAVMQYSRDTSDSWTFAKLGLWSLLGRIPGSLGQFYLQQMYGQVWWNYQRPGRQTPADPAFLEGIGHQTTFKTRAAAVALPREHLDGVIPKIAVPFFVVFGQHDIYGEHTQTLVSRYPNATIETWEGCGHLVWIDDEARFFQRLNDFYAAQP